MTGKSSRQDLLKSGCRVVEQVGFEGLTARAVAKEGNISTQPIYFVFQNMNELREGVKTYLFDEIRRIYFKENHSLLQFIENYQTFVEERTALYLSLMLTKETVHLQATTFFYQLFRESIATEEIERLSEAESRLALSRITGTMLYFIESEAERHPLSTELLIQLVLQDIQLIKERSYGD